MINDNGLTTVSYHYYGAEIKKTGQRLCFFIMNCYIIKRDKIYKAGEEA